MMMATNRNTRGDNGPFVYTPRESHRDPRDPTAGEGANPLNAIMQIQMCINNSKCLCIDSYIYAWIYANMYIYILEF